jgi:hypothetical protein
MQVDGIESRGGKSDQKGERDQWRPVTLTGCDSRQEWNNGEDGDVYKGTERLEKGRRDSIVTETSFTESGPSDLFKQ